jgi:hypothetical protein
MATSYANEIATLEKLINSATRDVSTDGLRASFDLDKAKSRLAELRRLAGGDSRRLARPKISTLNISNCW